MVLTEFVHTPWLTFELVLENQAILGGFFLVFFFLAAKILGRRLEHSIPTCAFFFFFLKWILARAH